MQVLVWKGKTLRSYFFAKSLLSRLKSKDAKDKIIRFLEGRGEAKSPEEFTAPDWSSTKLQLHQCTGCYNRGFSDTKQPHSCPLLSGACAGMWRWFRKLIWWTLNPSVSDGITLSCSRLCHRKENLYLLMALPLLQNCCIHEEGSTKKTRT